VNGKVENCHWVSNFLRKLYVNTKNSEGRRKLFESIKGVLSVIVGTFCNISKISMFINKNLLGEFFFCFLAKIQNSTY